MEIDVTDILLLADHRQAAEQSGYMELDGARKDGDCATVNVEGGVSKALGCCNIFLPEPKTQIFSCGTCVHIRPLSDAAGMDLSCELSEQRLADWMGIPIVIESRAGSTRYGRKLPADYGYIERVTGLDQMELDCFMRSGSAGEAFVIRMATEKANEQEDKCFLGFADEAEARAAFDAYYGAEKFLRSTAMTLDDFKSWLAMQGASVALSDVVGKPVAVDFDGTLAERRKGEGWEEGGPPIEKTFELIAELRKRGLDPYVLTARTDLDAVRDYLRRQDLTIDVTNVKKPGTLAVVDDRAVDAEKHGLKGMLRRVMEKIELAERVRKPDRSTPSAFWDDPVHALETHVNFRGIHSTIQQHESRLAAELAGPLRVKITRELAKQAAKQLAKGTKPHALTFDAPAEVEEHARPIVRTTYRAAAADAKEEASRLVARARPRLSLEEGDRKKAKEASALDQLLALLAGRFINFVGGALREAAISDPQIMELLDTGDVQGARARLEAFANDYSGGRLNALADQTTREAVRAGRADEFAADPRLADVVWRRSSVLEASTCTPCRLADMTEIPGPDYDVTEICEGAQMCRCLPVAILRDEVFP
jgi:hypothetical protein